ncbi:MAG: FecR family protein [Sphingobacteriaceae bacterium]|nr:MAG: FecR family protein [Sphingobacteriaceae bacterium]
MAKYNSREDIKLMIANYVAGTATAEEIEFVEDYYKYLEQNSASELSNGELTQLQESTFNRINQQLNNLSEPSIRTIKRYKYASVAAIFILSVAIGYFWVNDREVSKKPKVAVHQIYDIAPGTNKAILTLGNGSKVFLDEKADRKLKELSDLTVKTQNGKLIYLCSGKLSNNQHISTNTITTPKGGQYQVVLPDGTQVWLNAASSLTYPELFSGSKRTVKLQGEGYFEVSQNKAMPFHVETTDQDVEVTGTHFNINSYWDDRFTKTTLLEGSVNISSLGLNKVLVPGQQASVYTNPALIKVKTVDTDEDIAWKNGLFQFNNTSLKNILNQLERWYNVKVNYSDLPFKRYNGMISRSANLSEVLEMLELTGNIKFKIEANNVLEVSSNK